MECGGRGIGEEMKGGGDMRKGGAGDQGDRGNGGPAFYMQASGSLGCNINMTFSEYK